MPTKGLSIGTAQEIIVNQDANRSVLTIQNIHAGNILYVTDQLDNTQEVYVYPGGSLTLKKVDGSEPDKAWYGRGSAAATTTRILELYGDVAGSANLPPVVNPQNPQQPGVKVDAPLMR